MENRARPPAAAGKRAARQAGAHPAQKERACVMKDRRNVLSTVFVLTLAAVFVFVFWSLRERQDRMTDRNREIAQAEQRLGEEKKREGEEIYGQLVASVREALPGIVCWGDDAMAGNGRGSLPGKLAQWIAKTYFDEIKRELSDKTRVYNSAALEIDVAAMGAADEGLNEIMARCGARQLVLAEDYRIPHRQDRVNLTLMDDAGNLLYFAEQKYAKFGETTISGVVGKLYDGFGSFDRWHLKLSFARDQAGLSVVAPAGTPVYTAGATRYRAYQPVLFFTETAEVDAQTFVDSVRQILSLYGSGPYAVVCTASVGSAWDQALRQAFGARYLRNDRTVSQMREEDYQALAEKTFACLQDQGVFDGVAQAVAQARSRLEEIQ